MAALWFVYRYVVSAVKTFAGKFEKDFELQKAVRGDDRLEITADVCAALAADPDAHLQPGTVCTYTYKSTGPYAYIVSERNPSFPPTLQSFAPAAVVPPECTIILANLVVVNQQQEEQGEEEEEEDVTDTILQYAGPDGTFHGAIEKFDSNVDWAGVLRPLLTPLVFGAGNTLNIVFANGDTTSVVSNNVQ